jgi:hypothetical protein
MELWEEPLPSAIVKAEVKFDGTDQPVREIATNVEHAHLGPSCSPSPSLFTPARLSLLFSPVVNVYI